jgi:N-acyl-D-amino-acid deacylase
MQYDIILRGGTVYDGSGTPPITGDVAISGDQIAAIGDLSADTAPLEIDATGLAVAPGFINMLSWSPESLIEDGRSQSEIRQGVTLEVMGEGSSMGPLNDAMKADGPGSYMAQGDIKYDIEWTTLGEYLEWLEKRGVSCNIASFVGSSTLRIHTIGYDDRAPTDDEMNEMKRLLREAMEQGAMGLSAALIYTPAFYADIDELIELADVVAEYNGMYISHIRSEGSAFLEALDEFLEIARATGVRSEIYHLKAAGLSNWDKMDAAIEKIEQARADGLRVTADMYTYPFSGTGLDACIPPWAHEGGHDAMIARLKDPKTRERIKADMVKPSDDWENMFVENSPANILLAGFRQEHLKALQGKTLLEVMEMRGSKSARDTLIDLLIEDNSRIFTMYFSMSEDNLRKQMALPWVSFCSDAESQAPEGVFLKSIPHPRAYGSFARVPGKYVRDEQIIPLEEAIRRLSAFPAENLKIERRGSLKPGYFADVVAFDPATIQDHATPQNPHQYATGMKHVFVNGVQVLRDGEHTGAKPGRVVRGPGWKREPFEWAYDEPVRRLLSLGSDYNGLYREFNFRQAHVPELIRLATDVHVRFRDLDQDYIWGPVHAWRVLAQLEVVEAAEPLTQWFSLPDPSAMMELPAVYGLLGEKTIPVLHKVLTSDDWFPPRVMAARCLVEVGANADRDIGLLVEGILVEQLRRYRTNPKELNGFLVQTLTNIGSEIAEPVIDEALASGHVDETFLEDWDGAAVDHDDDLHDHEHEMDGLDFLLPGFGPARALPGSKKDAAKKKAKRKQAAKSRKMSRKKKR